MTAGQKEKRDELQRSKDIHYGNGYISKKSCRNSQQKAFFFFFVCGGK